MAFLTKQAILSADDMKYDSVSCPEWGGDVRVRGLTAYEQSFIAKLIGEEKKNEVTLKVVQFGCVDENGDRLFTANDLKELSQKSYPIIERIGIKIMHLSGMGNDEEVESIRKN